MLSIITAGRLGRDAELRNAGGEQVLAFSVAVDVQVGREKTTEWVSCSLWGKRGASLAPHMKKGTIVEVRGGATLRRYKDRSGENQVSLDLRVDDLALLGGGGERSASPGSREPAQQAFPNDDAAPGGGGNDDDIPF